MVDVNDIRNGMTLLIEGNIYQILDLVASKGCKGCSVVGSSDSENIQGL